MTNIDKITKIVFEYFGLLIELKDSRTRKREIVLARQFCFYFVDYYLPRISFKSIGEYYGGRDHSTVIHGIQTVNDLIETSKESRLLFNILKEKIEEDIKVEAKPIKSNNVYIISEEFVNKHFPKGLSPAECKKIDRDKYNETINVLIASCKEGMDGRWDCSTLEGKESFQPMIDDLETLYIK